MFRSNIKKNAIIVIHKKIQGVSAIPEGLSIITSHKLYNMLQWLHDEFVRDCENTQAIFDEEVPSQKQMAEREAFAVRNTSRTLSYITQLFVLETILKKEYEQTIEQIRLKIDEFVELNSTEIENRAKEIEQLKLFRDKVAAHTAFSWPKGDDNLATEFDSLLAILNCAYQSGDLRSFVIGAGQLKLGGVTAPRKIPEVGLGTIHPKMLKHWENWENMILDPLIRVADQLPIETDEYKLQRGS